MRMTERARDSGGRNGASEGSIESVQLREVIGRKGEVGLEKVENELLLIGRENHSLIKCSG